MAWDVIVVGAGAAGLVAGTRAAERGKRTLLVEKNRRPGAKILMSGGTRCNLTHATDERGIVTAFGRQGRFLHSALASLPPQAVVAMIEAEGVATKVEETGKVFPASDKAADVLEALTRRLARSGCELAREEPVTELLRSESGFRLTTPRALHEVGQVIVTTGGRSYPGCGTTGDAYAWLERLGHTIVPPCPALTPVTTHASWVASLRGVTIPDMSLQVIEPADAAGGNAKPRVLDARRGSLLFTHFGLSGPVVLDISRVVRVMIGRNNWSFVATSCPMSPLSNWKIDGEPHAADGKKQLAGIIGRVVPRRLADSFLERAALPPDARGADFTKKDRRRMVELAKQTRIPVAGTRGFQKAEVTAGGVDLREVDSSTMQSKLVPGLFLAGEVLDLDGPIGGYNFQAAFSTGWLAGSHVA